MSGSCGTLQLGVEATQIDSGALISGPASEASQTAAADVVLPTPLETSPAPTDANDNVEWYSSDLLGICFSYPQGYTEMPYNDAVEVVSPGPVPGTDEIALFWLDISDAQDRTAEEVADRELADVPGLNPDRWTVALGGEPALVLDGMPGQDLVRRVYIVRQQTLYILTFSPARSGIEAASEQMEALYAAVTSSWAWSACSTGE